jgi:CHAT domain
MRGAGTCADDEAVFGKPGYEIRAGRGEFANAGALRGLPPPVDTANELKIIARTLGASESDNVLGANATETAVKAINGAGRLADYRVVAFATHGLIAGNIRVSIGFQI